ncbi:MAG: VOC family protein [Candidatus Zixiibacteriota bacterium]
MNGVCHIELPCSDISKMKDFYSTVFGWETQYIPEMDYGMWKAPEGVGGGFAKNLKPATKGSGVLFHIQVDDIDSTLKMIEKSGGRTVQGKTQIPNIGHYAIFSDIAGNEIGIFQG